MQEAKQDAKPEAKPEAAAAETPKSRRRISKKLLILLAIPVVVGGGAGAAYMFVPGLAAMVKGALPGHAAPPAQAASQRPMFIDLPEMAVTLPNGGHPKQLRIRVSLELSPTATDVPASEVLSPRVYDALLTYLRTLRDGELDGSLALDRLRSDLYRRMDLVLGSGVVRDVLITGLVVG